MTQFPEAFCGGRVANSAPVAGLMLACGLVAIYGLWLLAICASFWFVRVDNLRFLAARRLVAAKEVALSVGARLGPVLAAETDPAVCANLLDRRQT